MKQQGATLIQIMLALALLSGLTYLGVPSYAAIREDLHLSVAAQELAQALRNARNQAALREQSVQVQAIDGSWGKGWRTALADDEQLFNERRLGKALKIAGNTGSRVRFSALGVPLGPGAAFYGGTLHVCRRLGGISAYQIVIATSGRISVRTATQAEPLCASR